MSMDFPARRGPAWAVSLYLSSLALWVGGAFFFSAGVLPVLFLNMPPHEAGGIAALLFPVYFRAALAAGVVSTLAAGRIAREGGRRWAAAALLLAAMTAVQGWTTLVLHPEMAEIRGVVGQEQRFQDLHRLSVRLNGFVLAGGALLLLAAGGLFSVGRDGDGGRGAP